MLFDIDKNAKDKIKMWDNEVSKTFPLIFEIISYDFFDRDSVAPSLLSVLAYSASVVFSVGVDLSNMPLILSQLVKDVMLIARNATGIIFFVYFIMMKWVMR